MLIDPSKIPHSREKIRDWFINEWLKEMRTNETEIVSRMRQNVETSTIKQLSRSCWTKSDVKYESGDEQMDESSRERFLSLVNKREHILDDYLTSELRFLINPIVEFADSIKDSLEPISDILLPHEFASKGLERIIVRFSFDYFRRVLHPLREPFLRLTLLDYDLMPVFESFLEDRPEKWVEHSLLPIPKEVKSRAEKTFALLREDEGWC